MLYSIKQQNLKLQKKETGTVISKGLKKKKIITNSIPQVTGDLLKK